MWCFWSFTWPGPQIQPEYYSVQIGQIGIYCRMTVVHEYMMYFSFAFQYYLSICFTESNLIRRRFFALRKSSLWGIGSSGFTHPSVLDFSDLHLTRHFSLNHSRYTLACLVFPSYIGSFTNTQHGSQLGEIEFPFTKNSTLSAVQIGYRTSYQSSLCFVLLSCLYYIVTCLRTFRFTESFDVVKLLIVFLALKLADQ